MIFKLAATLICTRVVVGVCCTSRLARLLGLLGVLGHRKRALNVSCCPSALAAGDRPKDGTDANSKRRVMSFQCALGAFV